MKPNHAELFLAILGALRAVADYGTQYDLPGLRPFPELYRRKVSSLNDEAMERNNDFEALISRGVGDHLRDICVNEQFYPSTKNRCDLCLRWEGSRYWVEYKTCLTLCLKRATDNTTKWDYSGTFRTKVTFGNYFAPFTRYVPEDMEKLQRLSRDHADYVGVLVTVFDHLQHPLTWDTIEANLPSDFASWSRIKVAESETTWMDRDERRRNDGFRETTYMWIKETA